MSSEYTSTDNIIHIIIYRYTCILLKLLLYKKEKCMVKIIIISEIFITVFSNLAKESKQKSKFGILLQC